MGITLYADDSPAGKIMSHLQRRGEGTIKDMEQLLGISTTAVREHLTHLQARGLIDARLVRQGPGRPHMTYFLTPKAQSLFPKEYDTLINLLLREITSQEGSDRVQVILNAVGARLAEEYRAQVSGEELTERLETLRGALEARGIPVEIQPSAEGFRFFACPYLEVAQEHAAVCAMDRRMVEQVLGESITLEEGTIREGRRSCHFLVVQEPKTGEGQARG